MDQQRSAVVKHTKCFCYTGPNLCPQHKSSLISGCLTNRHSDVASTHQHMA